MEDEEDEENGGGGRWEHDFVIDMRRRGGGGVHYSIERGGRAGAPLWIVWRYACIRGVTILLVTGSESIF